MKKTLTLPSDKVAELQEYLNKKISILGGTLLYETIWEETIKFENDYQVDIKMLDTPNGPYLEAILFLDNCELDSTINEAWKLLGTFEFATDEYGKTLTFILEIVEETNTEKFMKECQDN